MALETLKTYYSKKSLNLNNNNYYIYNSYNTENDNCNYKFFSSTIGFQCHEMIVLKITMKTTHSWTPRRNCQPHPEWPTPTPKKEGPTPTSRANPDPREGMAYVFPFVPFIIVMLIIPRIIIIIIIIEQHNSNYNFIFYCLFVFFVVCFSFSC